MKETDLRDLGIWRIPVPIPFVQAGGPANVYLLEERGGGVTLFDAGLGTREAEEALAAGFKALDRKFSEVHRIIISHGHLDHFGAARTVQEWHGGELPIFAHEADIDKMTEAGKTRFTDLLPAYGSFLVNAGLPIEVLEAMARANAKSEHMSRRLAAISPTGEGERLELRHVTLEVLHMPGHTPGVICLYDRAHRVLFSDDHLLQHVSPNPLLELDPSGQRTFRPLVAYIDSIARARELDVELVLPGHAEPFSDPRPIIDRLLGFYAKRQQKILEALAEAPLSAYDLVSKIFPKGYTDGDAGASNMYFMISEVIANADVLEERGALTRAQSGSSWRYQRLRETI